MKVWFGRGLLAGWLLAAVLGGKAGWAQVATTTVQDTVTDASGAAASGTVVVSWSAFTTAAGSSVAAGSLSTTLGTGGALNVALQPNAGATPMGSYYTAVFHLSDGTVSREFWVVPVNVPGGGPAKLAGIRNQALPTSMAMQTVSKQYVDTTVAKAMAGVPPSGSLPYVLKAGDTITGALTVDGPITVTADPMLPLQAADKHYVDAAVAGAESGSAGGDLSGSYPNPTVHAVHATSGSLDGVTVGATTPAPASFSQLTVSALGSGAVQAGALYCPGSQVCYLAVGTGFGLGQTGFPAIWISNVETPFMDVDTYGSASPMHFAGSRASFSTPVMFNNGAGPDVEGGTCASGHLYCAGNGSAAEVVWANSSGTYHATLYTPASSSAGCTAGDFADDANYHYVCVAASTWKRVALSAF